MLRQNDIIIVIIILSDDLFFLLRFFAKELYYRITTRPSIPNEHYEDQ